MDAKIPELPFEVFDLVLGTFLDEEPRKARPRYIVTNHPLKSCSLVSHSFRKIAQRFLFRSLVISSLSCARREVKTLEEILSRDDIGALCVKTVRITIPLDRQNRRDLIPSLRLLKDVSWLKLDDGIYKSNGWSNNLSSFKKAVERIMFSRTLRKLTLMNGKYLIARWISSLRNVNTLELLGVDGVWSDEADVSARNGDRGLPLKALRLVSCTDHIIGVLGLKPGELSNRVDWTKLRSIDFTTYTTGEGQTLQAILPQTSCLRTINIVNEATARRRSDGYLEDLLPRLHQSAFRTLVEITIEYRDRFKDPEGDPYDGLFSALKRFPPENTLRRIKFNVDILFGYDAMLSGGNISPWKAFQEVLVPSKFPALRRVVIVVRVSLENRNPEDKKAIWDRLDARGHVYRGQAFGEEEYVAKARDFMGQLGQLRLKGKTQGWAKLQVKFLRGHNWRRTQWHLS